MNGLKGGRATFVKINVTIENVGSFEEIAMTFAVKFMLQLQW
jgi:hypothetical protein